MDSFSNTFQENLAKYSPLRSRKSKQQEQQLATEQEQQDALDAFQEAFNTNLLADGQAILEKAVLEIVATGKINLDTWSDSSELRDFEAKYGPLAKSKLLVHIRSLNVTPANLPPLFKMCEMNDVYEGLTDAGCYVYADIDRIFVHIIDEDGRECPLNLTELARTDSAVQQELAALALSDQIYDPDSKASKQISQKIKQFAQVQYTSFLALQSALQMMRVWTHKNSLQILLNFLVTPETEQHRQQMLQNHPELRNLLLANGISLKQEQAEYELYENTAKAQESLEQKEQVAELENVRLSEPVEASAEPASIVTASTSIAEPQNNHNTPALEPAAPTPEPQKQKENVVDSFKHLLRDIFTSAVNFVFGTEVATIVLKKAGLHDSTNNSEHHSRVDTVTDKNENKPSKLSTSFFTLFKSVFTLPNVSANFGEKLVDPITPSPKK